ncbi:hypothetical protein [Kitasatospora sp. NPDC094011]|uniref:hypothetical protein n=1 Tax=Kitasatospora sp. NPDC094011 TaxID=3364090 RepID=UPI003809E798
MPSVTYPVPSRQRRSFLLWIIGLSVLPAAFIVANWQRDGWWGAGMFGPGILVVDLVYLNLASGRTVVDAHGIRTARLLGRRSWSWSEVGSIVVEVEESRRNGDVTHLTVHPVEGRPRRLYAPWAHDAIPGSDFDRAARGITEALAAHRSGATATGTPG